MADEFARSGRRTIAHVLLFGPLFVPAFLPFLGALASLVTLAIAPTQGPKVWRGASRGTSALAGLLAFLAFWTLPVLSLAGIVPSQSAFFLIPLCGPEDAVGYLVPAAAGLLVYVAGCAASTRHRLPWIWPGAAIVGVGAWELTRRITEAAGSGWVC